MITVIREKLLNNKVYKYVIWALSILLLILWAAPGKKGASNNWVAMVNGKEINGRDFVRKVHEKEQILQEYRRYMGPQVDQLIDPKAIAFKELVTEEILNQAVAAIPIYINDEYVHAKLSDPMFVYQVLSSVVPQQAIDQDNGINMAYLKTYLRQRGITLADFEAKIKEALQHYVLQQILMTAWYTPSFEILDQYMATHVEKNFSVLTLSLQDALKKVKTSTISSEELQNFYMNQESSRRYMVPEKRSGVVWKFDPAFYGIQITQEEAEAYYEENKHAKFVEKPAQLFVRTMAFNVSETQTEQEAYKKAKQAHAEFLKNPARLEQEGKVLPGLVKGKSEEAFDKAAFTLKKDGDISDVIATKKGFEIIQRINKKDPTFKSFKSVEQSIQSELRKRTFIQQFNQDIEQILDQNENQEEALKAFAQKHKTTPTDYKAVEKGNKGVAQALYSMHSQNELAPFSENGVGYVVKLTEIQKAYQPSLRDIKEAVENDLYNEKAGHLLKENLQKAQEMAANHSLKEVQAQFGGELKQTGMVKLSDKEKVKSLQAQSLPVEQMLQAEKVGAILALEGNNNAYLVRLDNIESFNEQDFSLKKAEVIDQLTRTRLEALVGGFVASLYRNATINANEALFSDIHQSQRQEILDYEE